MRFVQGVDIVLQPYGSFVSSKITNEFQVIDNSATAIILNAGMNAGIELPFDADKCAKIVSKMQAKGILEEGEQGCKSPNIYDAAISLEFVRADIEVTNRCNLACVYCYAEVNKSKFELSVGEWKEIIGSLNARGLRAVLFSGGEPFIRKDFMELVEWASERLIVEINTNGRYITDAIAERLSQLGVKRVQVSLDSVDSDYHDNLRGKFSHKYAIQAIEILTKHGVPVQISTVATADNEDEISKLIKFSETHNTTLNATPVSRKGFAANIDDEEWEKNFKTNKRHFSKTENSEEGLAAVPLCQSSVGYIAISFTGDMKPCNQREQYFAPTADTALSSRSSKWWERSYGESALGRAVSKLPFDARALSRRLDDATSPICDLQKFLLEELDPSKNELI